MRVDHVEMARLERQVLGLHDSATGAMNLRRGLRHLVEIGEVGDGRTPTTPVEVRDEGRPVDGRVDHVVAADGDGVLWIARLHLEHLRHLLDLLLDERRLEADAAVLDRQPRPPEGVEGARVEEIDADLLQNLHRMVVDLLNLILREDVVGLERVGPHGYELACASVRVTLR